jgi:hypothetical protein
MAKREAPTPELLTAFRAESCSPDDVESLIDLRVGQIDDEIKTHLAAVEQLRAERKRWVSVTGGRSRMNGGDGGKDAEEVAP